MEHFTLGTPPAAPSQNQPTWRSTASYFEAKWFLNGRWWPTYILKVGDDVAAAVSCWDNQFDPMIENMRQPQVEAIMRRKLPTWFRCADNAVRERYGDGALVEMLDPDDLNRKWMVAVLFPDSPEAGNRAVRKVLEISASYVDEAAQLKISKLDYLRAAAAGAAQGASTGYAFAEKLMKAKDWIPS